MPESPEVQALADFLGARLQGAVLAEAELAAFSVLKTVTPPLSGLSGMRCAGVVRHGKFLDIELVDASASGDVSVARHLVVHLARAGWIAFRAEAAPNPARPGRGPLMLRLTWTSDDGEVVGRVDMTEAGTRKSSAVYVVDSPTEVPGIVALGPDALRGEVEPTLLARILAGQGGSLIKGVLRQQSLLAGIGNAYSDEILHRARMSPYKKCNSFSADDVAVLHTAMTDVLGEAAAVARDRPPGELKDGKRSHMAVHARTGQPCPVCGTTIAEVAFADSSLQYCPGCQTGGKALADRRLSRLLK